jgi:Zn-dependent protease
MLPVPPLYGFHILSNFVPFLRTLSQQVLQQASFFLILLIFMTDLFKFVWTGGTWMAVALSGIWMALFGGG